MARSLRNAPSYSILFIYFFFAKKGRARCLRNVLIFHCTDMFYSKTRSTDPQSTLLAWKKLTGARIHGARVCLIEPCRSITLASLHSMKIRLVHVSIRRTPSTINTMETAIIIMAIAMVIIPMATTTTATIVATPTSTVMEATTTAPAAQWRTSTIKTITIIIVRTKMATMMTMKANRSYLGGRICGKLTVV